MPNIGAPELLVILLVALVVFGPRKLPELGKSLGNGLREFRKSTQGLKDSMNIDAPTPAVTPAAQLAPGFSGYCGCLVMRVLGDGPGGGLRVARNATTGVPIVERAVVSSDEAAFSGACTAAASVYAPAVGGFLLPTLLEAAWEFAILPSWQTPP